VDDELTREDLFQAADRLVEEVLSAAGVTRPPVDAVDLARRHFGMTVREEAAPNPRARVWGAGTGNALQLSPEASEESRQWTAARAVGARLKGDLLRRLGFDAGFRIGLSGESLPDLLARRLLTPGAWFAGDARGCDWDILELKRLYATAGHEVVAWRLLDLPTACVITVVENDHVHRRRSNAWRVSKTLQPAERECQRYVHGFSRPRVVSADGWTVQGWPLHRPDWKREILRSVADAE